MARFHRLNVADYPQHVMQRGNNRQSCFFEDADRAFYLKKLGEYAEKTETLVHAFVLMSNHVHLLLTPTIPDGVSKLMQCLGRSYVRYFNTKHQRTGTLWEGRFKSSLIQSSQYLLQVYRYIELNPVRANMVTHPLQYRWSSHHYNATNKTTSLLTPHSEYIELGKTPEARKSQYRKLFTHDLKGEVVDLISDHLIKAKVLGDEPFKSAMSQKLNKPIEPLNHGGDRRSIAFQEL